MAIRRAFLEEVRKDLNREGIPGRYILRIWCPISETVCFSYDNLDDDYNRHEGSVTWYRSIRGCEVEQLIKDYFMLQGAYSR